MREKSYTDVIRPLARALLAVAVAVAGSAPAGAAGPYSQRATARQRQTRPAEQAWPAQQAPASAYGKGYQKGYADGFAQGEADWHQGVPRDFQRSDAYAQRDRRYDPSLASSDEYIQAYELGFELGHTDGYYGRPRNPAEPANAAVLAKAAALAQAQREREREAGDARRDEQSRPREINPSREIDRQRGSGPIDIPGDTRLQIKLTSPIGTKISRVGDRFKAVVTSPANYEGATVEGHIATLNQSGRVSGRTEMGLAFDSITLQDGRSAQLSAELERVIESETVKKVDEEGNVQTGSRSKESQVRGGAGAAAGAIIGGIIGGGKGAVLGAVLGGAAGVGTVYVEGTKELILDPGTEMIIRTDRTRPR
jgi:hypothetical protein